MFVTDVASCAWLSRQMDPLNTVLVIDEPTMGADQGRVSLGSLDRLPLARWPYLRVPKTTN